MRREINELLKAYLDLYEELSNLTGDNLPKRLRQFNIRFKLSLDVTIDFKGEIPLTKSKSVRELYSLLIKLLEIWNAYEALKHYSYELGLISKNESIYKAYSQKLLKEYNCLEILKETLDELKQKYLINRTFESNIRGYMSHIENDSEIRSNLKKSCLSILEYFNDEKPISGIEIIALIYAERNMYYHNGETAILNMNYKNRNELLTILLKCLIIYILTLIIEILKRELEKVRGDI